MFDWVLNTTLELLNALDQGIVLEVDSKETRVKRTGFLADFFRMKFFCMQCPWGGKTLHYYVYYGHPIETLLSSWRFF